MEFVLILFLNGWATEVDKFSSKAECEQNKAVYIKKSKASGDDYKIWCEVKRNAKTT